MNKSQRTNVDKIRRHMARSTPDEVKALFDILDDDYQKKSEEWLRWFANRMRIKHNNNVRIDVYVDDGIRWDYKKSITARVSKT